MLQFACLKNANCVASICSSSLNSSIRILKCNASSRHEFLGNKTYLFLQMVTDMYALIHEAADADDKKWHIGNITNGFL